VKSILFGWASTFENGMTSREDPPLVGPEVVRSDRSHSETIQDYNLSEGAARRPRNRVSQNGKRFSSRSKLLAAAGAVLIAVSTALIIAGILLPDSTRTPPPPSPSSSGRDADGVPLDALKPPDPSNVRECGVTLGDWNHYASNAAAAESSLFGTPVRNISANEAEELLRVIQNDHLQLPVYFWVLSSPHHPWTAGFQKAAVEQTAVLSAAYAAMGLSFRLEGVFSILGTDTEVKSCHLTEDATSLTRQLMASVANSTVLHVVVCEPSEFNGATTVLGSAASSFGFDPAGVPIDGIHGTHDHAAGTGATSGQVTSIAGPLNVLDTAILLRRSALWQSLTSLVHQVGHYLALPHPYPDSKSCKFDADFVFDTPQQYQASASCDSQQGLPLCDSQLEQQLDVTQMPFRGFMDATNDTCRRFFTPGQVFRARAMLQALRPALYERGRNDARPFQPLRAVSAFQSSLAPSILIQKQITLAATKTAAAAGAAMSSRTDEANIVLNDASTADSSDLDQFFGLYRVASRLTTALDHAHLPLLEENSLSVDTSACVSADVEGSGFWTGELEQPFIFEAVRIAQPWELVRSYMQMPNQPRPAEAAQPVDTSTPSTLARNSSTPTAGDAAPSSVAVEARFPSVQIWVGNSLNWSENMLCTDRPVELTQVVQTLDCTTGEVAGKYVTVRWTNMPPSGFACLAHVLPLSTTAPPLISPNASASSVPGGFLHVDISTARAMQSSTSLNDEFSGDGGANKALHVTSPPSTASSSHHPFTASTDVDAEEVSASNFLHPNTDLGNTHSFNTQGRSSPAAAALPIACSATKAERLPWWSLDLGLDPAFIHGVRLALPHRCSGLNASQLQKDTKKWNITAVQCGAAVPYHLDVYVSGEALLDSRADATSSGSGKKNQSLLLDEISEGDARACVRNATIIPGRWVDINCGRVLRGKTVTIVGRQDRPAALELCGLRLIGGKPLVMGSDLAVSGGAVAPAQLMPYFAEVIDGEASTCLEAENRASGETAVNTSRSIDASLTQSNETMSWSAALQREYLVLGASLVARGSATRIDVLDLDGQIAWSSSKNETQSAQASGTVSSVLTTNGTWTMLRPFGVLAQSVRVSAFDSLCELQLLVSSDIAEPHQSAYEGGEGALLLRRLPASSARLFIYEYEEGNGEISSTASSFASTSSSSPLVSAAKEIDGTYVVDGKATTCVPLPAFSSHNKIGTGVKAVVRIDLSLDRSHMQSISKVHVLADASISNATVSLAMLSPSSAAANDTNNAVVDGLDDGTNAPLSIRQCQNGASQRLLPWEIAEFDCTAIINPTASSTLMVHSIVVELFDDQRWAKAAAAGGEQVARQESVLNAPSGTVHTSMLVPRQPSICEVFVSA
jgi:hypothetical protein